MAMSAHLVAVYRVNLTRIKLLTNDLEDGQFTMQPLAGMNHPAWILGHLTIAREWAKDLLKLPEREGWDAAEWMAKFNRGSQITGVRGDYPSKAVLLGALEQTHVEIEAAVMKMTEADFARQMPEGRLRSIFACVGDMVVGLMTQHEGFHLGQLSAWRRAMGFKPLF
jgi:hypothetical protein